MEIFYLLNISQLSQLISGQGLHMVCSVDLGPEVCPISKYYPAILIHCYQGGASLYMETAVIHWTVNNRVLQSSSRMQLTSAVLHSELQSRLVIDKTLAMDSGNYSCLPSYATPDWAMVHIVTGQGWVNTRNTNAITR